MKDFAESMVPGEAVEAVVSLEEGGRPRSLRWEGVSGMSS